MPLYVDVHNLSGATPEDVAKAHLADLATQGKHDVQYLKYWAHEDCSKVYCLVDAPTAEAANQVHREAHGLVAEKIIEVTPEIAEAFLGGGGVNSLGAAVIAGGGSAGALDPGIRTVLFTDIVGSTPLTQEVGDEAAMELIHLHDRIVRTALTETKGREVKHLGDGIMASFVSAAAAIRCATRIQRDLSKHCEEHREQSFKVRIGVAAGEPVEHHEDLFGSTVQLAARLCSSATADQILATNVVAELCVGKKLPFQDLGEITLKGFHLPVRVHSVAWSEPAEAGA
jgi:class 3 adenylate cyclase